MKKRPWIRLIIVGIALVVVVLLRQVGEQQESIGEPVPPRSETGRPITTDQAPRPGGLASGDAEIREAFRDRRSDVWVESSGTVEKLLRDDNEGSRHQLFILRLDSGQTVLISHNIDLAERVPAREGDRVTFRGEYEWNERGGVVHWTHHDPQGRHAGGFLTHAGETYR